METLYERCAGLDVHKDTAVACVRIATGRSAQREVKTFATTTTGLLELHDWLQSDAVTHVSMEAAGAYSEPAQGSAQVQPRPIARGAARSSDQASPLHAQAASTPDRSARLLDRAIGGAGARGHRSLSPPSRAADGHPRRRRNGRVGIARRNRNRHERLFFRGAPSVVGRDVPT